MNSRILFYLAIVSFLPLFFLGMHHLSEMNHLNNIQHEIATLYRIAAQRERKQFLNRTAHKTYHGGDRLYIDNLESYIFCKPEIEALTTLLGQEPHLPSKEVTKRLKLLKEENRLTFNEGAFQTDARVQESTLKLAKPIELNTEDLRTLLKSIEQAHDAPQLLITDFQLKRKNQSFVLNLTLLKREYL